MKSKFKAVLYKHLDFYAARDIHRCYGNQAIYVIPATPAAYEAQVGAMADAITRAEIRRCGTGNPRSYTRRFAKSALAAIGIKKPTKGNE